MLEFAVAVGALVYALYLGNKLAVTNSEVKNLKTRIAQLEK